MQQGKAWDELRAKIEVMYPQLMTGLNGAVSKQDLAQLTVWFKQEVKQELPANLLTLYSANDGENQSVTLGYMFGLSFMSLSQVLRTLEDGRAFLEEYDDEVHAFCASRETGKVKLLLANAKWVPLLTDGCDNFIGLDFDPDSQGTFGQVINFGPDEEEKFVFADSLEEFFELLFHCLEHAVWDSDAHMFHFQKMQFIDALKMIYFEC
ncbi:SMI1/KNR4 family protein [Shewanella surugensis]|uniref:SMI1/KNR4 family protein n=1 Tax=Shewanella surugensis TaxID=212020 RepID=A0ABT0L9E6_9GAMM|nr:SMI1/KNR4 family protein [Shewanella surugensis]MCL1124304.1 SMI1/KNR4 family protein [Shewanella surugensis]